MSPWPILGEMLIEPITDWAQINFMLSNTMLCYVLAVHLLEIFI